MESDITSKGITRSISILAILVAMPIVMELISMMEQPPSPPPPPPPPPPPTPEADTTGFEFMVG